MRQAKGVLLEQGTEAFTETSPGWFVLGPVDDPQWQWDPSARDQCRVHAGLDRGPATKDPSCGLAVPGNPDVKNIGILEILGPG